MKSLSNTLILILISSDLSSAASVAVGTLSTALMDQPGFTSANSPSIVMALDLSSPVGLVPGEPIQISYAPEAPIWTMGIHPITGIAELRGKVAYEFTVGTSIFSFATEWTAFGPGYVVTTPPPMGNVITTDPSGYSIGPVPSPMVFTVPWSADLGMVGLRIIDQSSYISDASGYLNSSIMSGAGGTITTSTVPEASVWLMGLTSAGFAFRRRLSSRPAA